YTVPASRSSKSSPPPAKKPGYLASESDIVGWLREKTGLEEGQRHPLAWLMEACDDIAYCVLDIEDAMKKWIVSPEDVLAHLQKKLTTTEGERLTRCLEDDFNRSVDSRSLAEA